MRSKIRSIAVAALAFVFYSCAENSVTGPDFDSVHKTASAVAPPPIVISQVYGGGGSGTAGTAYTRDFIELHNTTSQPLPIAGWAVGYASSAGNSWNLINLPAVMIPAGGYYLVATGAAGAAGAPVPADLFASPGPSMAAGAGKVILVSSQAAIANNTCPSGYMDFVAYGSGSTNCNGLGSTGTINTTTSVSRGDGGCLYTPSMADFAVGPVAPRNSGTTARVCSVTPPQPVVSTVSVSTTTPSVELGAKPQFTAKAYDNANPPAEISGVTFTWSSSNTSIATVDANGLVTTLTAGDVLISAKAPNEVTGSASLHITEPPPPPPFADVVISQVYGGGGNAGSSILHDFVELYNRSNAVVDLTGWSVQYASATATSWQVTPLTGSIQPGKYFLVREAAGASATATAIANPDVIGGIAMGAGAGKIVLSRTVGTLSGACPTVAVVNDRVAYGAPGSSNNCVSTWGAQLSSDLQNNIQAAWRNNDGCDNTGVVANDFTAMAPDPRTSGSPAKVCGQPPRTQSSATVVINELMQDPVNAESASWGQWFEVHNYGSAPVDMQGWTIVSAGSSQPDHVIASSVVVPAGGYAVLGRGADIARNGGVDLDYNYFVGQTKTIWLDSKDFLMLVDNTNARVDSVAWTNMPHGVSKGLRNPASDNADADGPNWGYSTDTFGQGDFGTPGANNEPLANTPPAVSTNHITVSGRIATDAPLPVGFESQIFPSLLNQSNQVQNGHTFTWSSLTPDIASIDPVTGVIHSLKAGTAVFHVVADDGTVKNHSLPMEDGTLGNAQYGNNTEFGDPVDNTPADEYVVRRPQYTTSYNQFKGTPNWVSYDLNGSQFQSGTDRCNCFTHDPLLPAGFQHLTTNDYTGAGSFAAAGRTPPAGWSYGIDRGHMTRSSDRTTGTIDNADTYYLSNVVPQFADLNQGPWNNMEADLHAMAATGTKEIYIITGPAGKNTTTTPGSDGTVKNEGKIVIPASTWKIAVIMPRGKGLADVHSPADLQIIAVNMPNVPGIRNEDYHQWETTVDALEQLTGYNFLAALPDNIEAVVEGRTRAPTAQPGGPYSAVEGSPVAFDGSASSDPDNDALTFAWQFGDGATGTGVTTSHVYADNGSFTAILTATDPAGADDATDTPVTITNANPVVSAGTAFTTVTGQSVTLASSFSDAGANDSPWGYTVDWGDGSSSTGSTSTQGAFSTTHTYATAGSYSVSVSVTDKDGGVGTGAVAAVVHAAPTAATNGAYSSIEGGAVAMSGAASTDVDGTIASYAWDFGDGSTGTGAAVSHTYAQDGSYTVTLVVKDNDGLTGTVTTTATVANAAASINAFAGASLLPGESYGTNGSFTDPGADSWTATVNYGDGSGTAALSLAGKNFSLAHTYSAPGTYTVTVTVNDGSATSTSTATVVVKTAGQGVQDAIAIVNQFVADGKLSNGNGNSLIAKLNAAQNQIGNGNTNAALNQLQAALNEINSMQNTGKLSAADANTLRTAINRVIAAIS
jgi:DNA/RNA endonuclease G (NUC1)/PKD repeat protein